MNDHGAWPIVLNYTLSLNCTAQPVLPPAAFNVTSNVSTLYVGEVSPPFLVSVTRLPQNVGGLTLLVNSSRGDCGFCVSAM